MVKQISLGSAVRVGGFLDRKAGCFLLMKNGGAVIPSFLSSIVYSLYLMKNDYFVYGVLVLLLPSNGGGILTSVSSTQPHT